MTVAEDGERGLDALDRVDPDLVLLDFAMLGMNGAEVADRARLKRPELPIIFAVAIRRRLRSKPQSGVPLWF